SLSTGWTVLDEAAEQEFVGYTTLAVETDVVAVRRENGRVALQLRENPFYSESGGQISDEGIVEGENWRVLVDDVRKVGGRTAVLGNVDDELPAAESGTTWRVAARVYEARRDTMRHH